MDCGRYLRADSMSVNKGRLDYARVLVSTSSLDVVSVTKQILVDGVLRDIKIIEEWGFNLGEDACLFEDDDRSAHSSPDGDEVHAGFEMDENVDMLADKIVEDLVDVDEEEVLVDEHDKSANLETSELIVGYVANEPIVTDSPKEVSKEGASSTNKIDSAVMFRAVGAQLFKGPHQQFSVGSTPTRRVRRSKTATRAQSDQQEVVSRKRRVKSFVSSRDDSGSGRTGSWSAEWLHNVQKGDIGLISLSKKRLKKMGVDFVTKGGGVRSQVVRKKAGGVFHHPVFTLKKVARLPSKDREEVMKVLKKSNMKVLKQKVRNRQRQRQMVTKSLEVNQGSTNESTSVDSVNNDWKHWVTLQGKDKAIEEDIQGIGRAIGGSFAADSHNKFRVLSRTKNLDVGPVLRPVMEEVGEVVEGGGNKGVGSVLGGGRG